MGPKPCLIDANAGPDTINCGAKAVSNGPEELGLEAAKCGGLRPNAVKLGPQAANTGPEAVNIGTDAMP